VTRQNASMITARLILLAPRVRSVNLIGTSVTVSPALIARSVRSIWNQ